MELEWISIIVTALTSGGLASIGSLWYSRKRSKAEVQQLEANAQIAQSEAIKGVQDVYQELVEDLQNSWSKQKAYNEELMGKADALEKRIVVLKKEVEDNARKIAFIMPYTCCVKDCKDRVVFDGNCDLVRKGGKKNGSDKRAVKSMRSEQ